MGVANRGKSVIRRRGSSRPRLRGLSSSPGAARRGSPERRTRMKRKRKAVRRSSSRISRKLARSNRAALPASKAAALFDGIRREGEAVGAAWRTATPNGGLQELKKHIQQAWTARSAGVGEQLQKLGWQQIWGQGEAFGQGAMTGAGYSAGFAPLPLRGSAAAVLYADPDSEASLHTVLSELDRLPLAETIVVAGEVSEKWLTQARSHASASIVCYPEEVDADVGRALGAKLTGADIVLFVDARRPVPAERLARYLWASDGGLDVVLSDVSDRGTFHRRAPIARLREFLNVTLNRPDLRMNAIGPLPFALSRNALDTIGPADLAIPAKAHAVAVIRGLSIGTAWRTEGERGLDGDSAYADLPLALGDHFEAWRAATTLRGNRLRFEDRLRARRAVGGVVSDEILDHYTDE